MELPEPKFSDVLPYVLGLVGLAFNIAVVFFATLWNVAFLISLVVLALLVIPYGALLVVAIVRARRQPLLLKVALVSVLCTVVAFSYDPEWFRSRTVLKAELIDDLSRLDLIIRADGSCSIRVTAMFGFTANHHGRCEVEGERVVFHEIPYSPESFFGSEGIIVNDKIALRRTATGEPDLSFANYFRITYQR